MIRYQTLTQANVYLRKLQVGVLEKKTAESYSFQYSTEYLRTKTPIPIACAFPLKPEAYVFRELHPFFDNLILEGWLLSRAEQIFHIDKKNRFALLMAVGSSPIGAVSVQALNPNGEEYSNNKLHETIESFPTRFEKIDFPNKGGFCPSCLNKSPSKKIFHFRCATALWGTSRKIKIELDAERPLETFSRTIYGGSISGAQRKGLFSLDQSRAKMHADPSQSEYILKPEGEHPELPANEHLTMAIAQELGFRVPPFALIKIQSLGYVYVIRRFDRLSGVYRKMEDMAQITGASSLDKYESSNEKIANAIRRYASAPMLDLYDFFRRLLFCFFIGNADMHLKNWSLLEKESLNGELDLSPCYDLLNTRLPIPREQIDIGLPICGKSRNLQMSYFKKFATNILRMEQIQIKTIFSELKNWMQVTHDFTMRSYLTPDSQKKYLKIVAERMNI